MNRRAGLLAAVAIILCGIVSVVRADSLTIGNIEYKDVRVTAVKDGQIQFVTSTGRDTERPLAAVQRMNLVDEPLLNQAEAAYVAQQWDKAADGYEKCARSTQKVWLREWCAVRLLDAANKAGRFDVTIANFIRQAERSPQTAALITLTMPKAGSAYLPEARKSLQTALAKGPKENVRELLLKVLGDVCTVMGDTKGATEAAEALVQMRIAKNPNSAEALAAALTLKLRNLQAALANKDYDRVLQMIEKESAAFTERADQTMVLFYLAEALAGKAAAGKDAEAWKDVAVAYLRVVSNGPATAEQVPQALLKLAAIHAGPLNDKGAAEALYKQVQQEYKDQEAAKKATAELEKLGR